MYRPTKCMRGLLSTAASSEKNPTTCLCTNHPFAFLLEATLDKVSDLIERACQLRLEPADLWRPVACDGRSWLTVASAADLSLLEPSNRVTEFESSESALRALRSTDHASFAYVDNLHRNALIECRPRARENLYVSRQGSSIEVAAGLLHVSSTVHSATLSRRFLAIWLANAAKYCSFDHFLGFSPFEEYHLIKQGLCAKIDLITSQVETAFLSNEGDPPSPADNLEEAIENCRNALRYSISVAAAQSDIVISECSGGIDSSLVAVIASDLLGDRFLGGVFADHPYHEFRREREFAQSVATQAGFALLRSTPQMAWCWGALNDHRMHVSISEPSCMISFWGHALASYDCVSGNEKPLILTGIGGDRLFQVTEPLVPLPNKPSWISSSLWDATRAECENITTWLSAPERFASGYGFLNPWFSRTLGLLHPGALYYSPLTTRSVIDAFTDLRRIVGNDIPGSSASPQISRIQKPLAHLVFADRLPESLWLRRWKIDFSGLYYRSWLKRGKELISIVKRMQPQLEALGFNSKSLVAHVKDMADGKNSAERMLNTVVAYAYWLDRFKESER
jgi:hypothetical protein